MPIFNLPKNGTLCTNGLIRVNSSILAYLSEWFHPTFLHWRKYSYRLRRNSAKKLCLIISLLKVTLIPVVTKMTIGLYLIAEIHCSRSVPNKNSLRVVFASLPIASHADLRLLHVYRCDSTQLNWPVELSWVASYRHEMGLQQRTTAYGRPNYQFQVLNMLIIHSPRRVQ